MSDPQSEGNQPNETLRLLMSRASCRSFSGRKVPAEVLRQILTAGTQAPSGGNLQPYSIIKIENDETLQKLVGLCGGQKVIGRAPLALLFALHLLQGYGLVMFWGWVLFWAAIALQVVPFFAELAGLKKVGPFRLSALTGAATIAAELKKL